jgi:N-acetylglucosamine-6-phosphate deacetylase
MSTAYALTGAEIFDGESWQADSALVVDGGLVKDIAAASTLPGDLRKVELKGGKLVPGFIDIQVNGGGGVLLNDGPSVDAIRTICDAHFAFGTTALLPTLITDTPEITAAALAAGKAAAQEKVAGFLGLHIEGPHLSVSHKGTHDPKLIRPMDDAGSPDNRRTGNGAGRQDQGHGRRRGDRQSRPQRRFIRSRHGSQGCRCHDGNASVQCDEPAWSS